MNRLACLLAALVISPAATGMETHDPSGKAAAWQQSLSRTPIAVTAAFDPSGRLWRARVRDGRVHLDRSDDLGQTFGPSVPVNDTPEYISADGENRPKLAFGTQGEIYLSWTRSLDTPYAGEVRFSRSLDSGQSFSAPITVNDDGQPIGHRFDSLVVDRAGKIWVLWLDKRDKAAAEAKGEPWTGISLYAAVSKDRGARFEPNRRLAAHTCECCRIATTLDHDGVPVAAWRHVFGANIRDHQLLRLDGRSAPIRLGQEGWAMDACPHHGPALATGGDGTLHAAWYSGAPDDTGLHYARALETAPQGGARKNALKQQARVFSTPIPFGQPGKQAGHPTLAVRGHEVYLAWKVFDGKTAIHLLRSQDDGQTWSAPERLMETDSASDRPWLITDGRHVLLSWNTAGEGHRLQEIDPESPARPFVQGSWRDLLDDHRGRPLIVAFWSLTCTHCKHNLSVLEQLRRNHPEMGLALVSTDTFGPDTAVISDTLRGHRLNHAESWIFADDYIERLRHEIDPRWHGELPRSFLVSADGRMDAVTGKLDPDGLRQWLARASAPAGAGSARLSQRP